MHVGVAGDRGGHGGYRLRGHGGIDGDGGGHRDIRKPKEETILSTQTSNI